jgi:predicted nucleic acid-binding protein
MPNTAIADTSCLILLYKIDELNLLRLLYDKVIITRDVADEFGLQLPQWIEVTEEVDRQFQSLLELEIDSGEASSISLALKVNSAILILDDLRARRVADKLGLTYTGTFGLIAKSKIEGVIESIKPIISKIRKTNFRISDKVIEETLREAGEK